MAEKEFQEVSIDDIVHNNLKAMIGEYRIAAKDYHAVMLPVLDLLHKLSSREWVVVQNPDHPNNALKKGAKDE